MSKFKNSNATFLVIFKQCVRVRVPSDLMHACAIGCTPSGLPGLFIFFCRVALKGQMCGYSEVQLPEMHKNLQSYVESRHNLASHQLVIKVSFHRTP